LKFISTEFKSQYLENIFFLGVLGGRGKSFLPSGIIGRSSWEKLKGQCCVK
jgi:hypothetical protein